MNKHFVAVFGASLALLSTAHAQSSATPATSPAAASPAPSRTSSTRTFPIDPEKEKLIRRMMEFMQTATVADDMAAQTLESMKASVPGAPAEFWTQFQTKVKPQELQDQLITIYDRYFTKEDLQAALAFYQTPIGQKMISEMPALVRDSMAAGQEWSRKVGEEAARELDKRGLLKKASPSPGASPAAGRSASPKATATPKP